MTGIVAVIGAGFLLRVADGMPDLFTRMSSGTRAATAGIAGMLGTMAARFGRLGVTPWSRAPIAVGF